MKEQHKSVIGGSVFVYLLKEVKRARICDWWISVWHREHHGNAASKRGTRSAVEIFLLCCSRLTQVNMDVNQT